MQLLIEQPNRMLAEKRALEALAAKAPWLTKLAWGLTDTREVCVDFDITLPLTGRVYETLLVYPNLFPDIPPIVRPRRASEQWTSHQYPGSGALCLEWGPDNWHPGVTSADLVENTFRLLSLETFGPELNIETPSRHAPSLGQRLRCTHMRFLMTPEFRRRLAELSTGTKTPLTTVTNGRFDTLVTMVTRLGIPSVPPFPEIPALLADSPLATVWTREGWLIATDQMDELPDEVNSQAQLRNFLHQVDLRPWVDDADRDNTFIVLVGNTRRPRAFALSTVGTKSIFEYTVVDCSDIASARQPESNAALVGKRAAVVGVGSVGSKTAVSLARSGLRDFLLVDDDIVEPANLVRNQLDWQSVGFHKVDAVKAAVQMVAPDAKVDIMAYRLAGQESAQANSARLERIAACDIVIDATADSSVFTTLAAICARRRTALVWGEVFAGGIGGLMVRSRPGIDADPLSVRTAINGYLDTLPPAPFADAVGYEVRTDGVLLVAGDAEVSQFGAAMTQFAIDALLGNAPPRFSESAYLTGFQKAWIFEGPFDTIPIACPTAADVPPMRAETEFNAAALSELSGAIGEGQDADREPTA
jgi:hypothetical protein